jgi:hypothetical protein
VYGSAQRHGGAAVEQTLQHLHIILPADRRRHALQPARRRNGRHLRLVRARALSPQPFILQLINHRQYDLDQAGVLQRWVLSRVSESERDVMASVAISVALLEIQMFEQICMRNEAKFYYSLKR